MRIMNAVVGEVVSMLTDEYQMVLRKMYLMEAMGECLYTALASKAPDSSRSEIYRRLAQNEYDTARRIADELQRQGIGTPTLIKTGVSVLLRVVFVILPYRMLAHILRKALGKQKFRLWFDQFHQQSEVFWHLMLEHEVLQYELLEL